MLMQLYHKLWTSADFESDFERDWKTAYNRMREHGESDCLPPFIVEMCYEYMVEWEKKNK
jgi:hypothetical protein